jgi:hypothetical protein
MSGRGDRKQKVDEMRMKRILESSPRGATFAVSRLNFVMLLLVLNQNCTGSKGWKLFESQELFLLIKT